MFGEDIPEPRDILVTRWSKDPFALGAYSYTGVGVRFRDFNQLSGPIKNRLVLAGEHPTFKYYATLYGAYLSGLKASDIIEDLV